MVPIKEHNPLGYEAVKTLHCSTAYWEMIQLKGVTKAAWWLGCNVLSHLTVRWKEQCSADVHLNAELCFLAKKKEMQGSANSLFPVSFNVASDIWGMGFYFVTAKTAGTVWHRMGSYTPFSARKEERG